MFLLVLQQHIFPRWTNFKIPRFITTRISFPNSYQLPMWISVRAKALFSSSNSLCNYKISALNFLICLVEAPSDSSIHMWSQFACPRQVVIVGWYLHCPHYLREWNNFLNIFLSNIVLSFSHKLYLWKSKSGIGPLWKC